MSEIPAPYGNKEKKKSDIERIAAFMTRFLEVGILGTFPYPEDLQKIYQDLDNPGKNEWYEHTFSAVFRDACQSVIGLLGRVLKPVEINLIKRRIVNYFKQAGIEYNKK